MRISEGHVSVDRRFNGKPFGLARVDGEVAWEISKSLANKVAKAYRARGWLARSVKVSHGHAVYRSQNKATFYK